eukprot:gene12063-25280_t
MEVACGSFEREFKKIYNDLDFVAHRLEADFSCHGQGPNILVLVRRIHELEAKLSVTSAKCNHLVNARKNVAMDTVHELLQNFDEIYNFSNEVGCDFNTVDVVVPKEELLHASTKCRIGENYSIRNAREACPNHIAPSAQPITLKKVSTTKKTRSWPQNMNFTEEQFLQIPETIRGKNKNKFHDAKRMHLKLIHDYNLLKCSGAESITSPRVTSLQELHEAGCVVLGKAGDCVLGALVTLDLIKVSKDGVQLLLRDL